MNFNFKDINYLKMGTNKQKQAYHVLTKYRLLEILHQYDPLFVGTIPINIDIDSSDIDIILETKNLTDLKNLLLLSFSDHQNFMLRDSSETALICKFSLENMSIEIYSENRQTDKQYGYLHMLKEYEILQSNDEHFRQAIISLKKEGWKTEPAFCKLLNIVGDPYTELLNYNMENQTIFRSY